MYSSIAIISILAVAQAVNLEDWQHTAAAEECDMDMEQVEECDMGMEYDLDDGIVVVDEEPMHEHGWMKSGHNGNGWRGRGSHPRHGEWGHWASEEEVTLDDGIVEVDEEPMH